MESKRKKKPKDIEEIIKQRKLLNDRWQSKNSPIKQNPPVNFTKELDSLTDLNKKLEEDESMDTEDYEDTGETILQIEKHQQIWNRTNSLKRTVYRKGQVNLKIENILSYENYSIDEKDILSLNLFYLMSANREQASYCEDILNHWDWQPKFENILLVFENIGFDVKDILKDHYICENYLEKIEETKLIYEQFCSNQKKTDKLNVKHASDEIDGPKLDISQMKNVLRYLTSIIECLNKKEIESIIILLCVASLDKHFIQYSDLFKDVVNICFDYVDKMDGIMRTLYTSITNTQYQCFLVNKILRLHNEQYCKLFVSKLAYLFMYNLIFNDQVDVNKKVQHVVIDISDEDIDIKQKNNLIDVESNEKSKVTTQAKRKVENLKDTDQNKLKKEVCNKKSKKTKNSNDTLKQTSLLSFFQKSPDLSKKIEIDHSNKIEKSSTNKKQYEKENAEMNSQSLESSSQSVSNVNKDYGKDIGVKTEIEFEKDSKEPKHIQIFNKHRNDQISFESLHLLIHKNIRSCVHNPLKIYRIVNLLNNIIENIKINVENIDTCILIMNILQQVEIWYMKPGDIQKQLVRNYLQQYSMKWLAVINDHRYHREDEDEPNNNVNHFE